MARDIDRFFVTTGILSITVLVFILSIIQTIISTLSFDSFLLALGMLNFIFILGAVVLSATTWTETPKNAYILAILLTLLSILFYNLLVGGFSGVWGANAIISAINWAVNILLTIVVTCGIYYIRFRYKR